VVGGFGTSPACQRSARDPESDSRSHTSDGSGSSHTWRKRRCSTAARTRSLSGSSSGGGTSAAFSIEPKETSASPEMRWPLSDSVSDQLVPSIIEPDPLSAVHTSATPSPSRSSMGASLLPGRQSAARASSRLNGAIMPTQYV
jgi:hypothetical protein